ncbi:ABC-three component system middle component 1 [Paenibacillus sp. FSL K6-2524]|uniref:ABC-three component system middle component 1 n=1 Tax=Paenibacillus sp. FSL K6-2524 TaxID=2954516 RepID=UPI0030F55A7C
MIEEIVEFFEKNGFIKLNQLDFNYLNAVCVSTEQIYGFAQFETEAELRGNWEKAADELAVKLQSRLIKELHMLKWDVYLMVIITQNQIDTSYRKLIENDRHYFRKIVITKNDDPYINRIPFVLDLTNNKELLIFNDNEFFEEFRECLQKSTLSKLPQDFFNPKLTADQLIDFFSSIKKDDLN